MKKKLLNAGFAAGLLMPLLLMACGGGKAPQDGGHGIGIDSATVAQIDGEEEYVPQRSDYAFRTEVRTVKEDDEVYWDTIVVYLTDARGTTQKLYSQAMPLDTTNWSRSSIGDIVEDDWNFDGIADLQVGKGPMNGFGNFTYDVWLWNDSSHRFEHLDCPSELFSPSVDQEGKRIVSVWRLDQEVEIIRYQWKDGKLVEAEREQMSTDDLTDD